MTKNTINITDKETIIYLVAKGFNILNSYSDGTKSIMEFEKTKEFKKAILDYTNQRGSINIADFLAAEKRVTNLIHINKKIV